MAIYRNEKTGETVESHLTKPELVEILTRVLARKDSQFVSDLRRYADEWGGRGLVYGREFWAHKIAQEQLALEAGTAPKAEEKKGTDS